MPTYPHAGFFPPLYFPNQYGKPTPGAHVGLYEVGTDTLATLYEDRDRAVAADNPFTLDTAGNSPPFYGEPNEYDARRVVLGVPQTALVRVEIKVDDADAIDEPSGADEALIPTDVKSADYVAQPQDLVPVDTTAGPVVITLPNAPDDGSRVAVKLVVQPGTDIVTVNTAGADVFDTVGGPTSLTLTFLNQVVSVQYDDGIWYAVDSGLSASTVNHGIDPNVTRPSTSSPVLWEGTVEPNNMEEGDWWLDTDALVPLLNPPQLLIPPASILTTAGDVAWSTQYGAIFHRFQLNQATVMRYIGCRIGTSSGNIQVGVVGLSGASDLDYTRIAHSGIIPSPGTGTRRIDLGPFLLDPTTFREFAVFFWADNTTLTAPAVTAVQAAPMRMAHSSTLDSAGVLPSGTLPDWASTRILIGLCVEGDL